jgi:hypothetical protein
VKPRDKEGSKITPKQLEELISDKDIFSDCDEEEDEPVKPPTIH